MIKTKLAVYCICRLPNNGKPMIKTKLAVCCICRLPNDGKPMIKCNKCKKWHHSQCVNLNLMDLDELKSSQWNCYMCAM